MWIIIIIICEQQYEDLKSSNIYYDQKEQYILSDALHFNPMGHATHIHCVACEWTCMGDAWVIGIHIHKPQHHATHHGHRISRRTMETLWHTTKTYRKTKLNIDTSHPSHNTARQQPPHPHPSVHAGSVTRLEELRRVSKTCENASAESTAISIIVQNR